MRVSSSGGPIALENTHFVRFAVSRGTSSETYRDPSLEPKELILASSICPHTKNGSIKGWSSYVYKDNTQTHTPSHCAVFEPGL